VRAVQRGVKARAISVQAYYVHGLAAFFSRQKFNTCVDAGSVISAQALTLTNSQTIYYENLRKQ
jgi:hypothetical protein